MLFSRSSLALLTVSLLAAFSPATRAATIIWSSPTNITGDTNVVNVGPLVGAFNLGTAGVPSTTVNGVTFAPFAVPNDLGTSTVTMGNFSIGFRGGRFAENTAFGSSSGAFASLSSSYQTLLRSGIDDSSFNNSPRVTLTMSGLTIGVVYTFQWWANDSARVLDDGATTATSGTSVVVDWNTTNTAGGVGQFAIGTFTADAVTQVITFTHPTDALVNAFQLRMAAPIPEPSTWALLVGGCASLVALRRRRR